MDLLDRFFGLWHWPRSGSGFKPRAAYVRRVDLVIVPVEQWGFGVMGWTGSRCDKRLFSQLSLCLSRACLGKKIVYIYTWLKKTCFRASRLYPTFRNDLFTKTGSGET
jgi:hypothetical protein